MRCPVEVEIKEKASKIAGFFFLNKAVIYTQPSL